MGAAGVARGGSLRAVVLGGTGLIGRATAHRLLAAGWDVEVTGRRPDRMPADLAAAGVGFRRARRDDADEVGAAIGRGADLLVDCVCMTAAHAERLLPLLVDCGSTVMVSTKAVYVDNAGKHSNTPAQPRFDGPVRENQPTMAAASDGEFTSRYGYGANKVAAEQTLLGFDHPTTVLRPSKIHGIGARPPREWLFVKRVLDCRPAILLARGGRSVEHTTAAVNIAALIEVVATAPDRRVLNIADPDTPSVLEMSRSISSYLGHSWDEVLLGDAVDPALGRTPWDREHDIVLDVSAALALGYQPAGDYATTVRAMLDWLVELAIPEPDGARLPEDWDDDFFDGRFDYRSEDAYLASPE